MGRESLCLHLGNLLYMFAKRGNQVRFVIFIVYINVIYWKINCRVAFWKSRGNYFFEKKFRAKANTSRISQIGIVRIIIV